MAISITTLTSLCLGFTLYLTSSGVAQLLTPSPAPAPLDCSSPLLELVPCLGFVEGKVSRPSKRCCVYLNLVLSSIPAPCLCTILNPSSPFGFPFNLTHVLQLPLRCRVRWLRVSHCTGMHSPAMAPSQSPSYAPMESPSPAVFPTPAKSVPSSPAAPLPSSISSSPSSFNRSPPPSPSYSSDSRPPVPAHPPISSSASTLPISAAAACCALLLLLGINRRIN